MVSTSVLFFEKNRLGAELYLHTVTLPLLTLDGDVLANVNNAETRFNIRLSRQFYSKVKGGLGFILYENKFTFDNSTPEKEGLNAAFMTKNSLKNGLTVSVQPQVVFWRIDVDRFYIKGMEFEINTELASSLLGSDFDFIKGLIKWQGAYRPMEKLNVVAQFKLGSKTGREFQHKFYLGGLDSLRGFFDSQFRSEHMWVINVEVRPTLIEKERWILQGNIFADLGKTWDSKRFGFDGFENPFVSYGVGARIILPHIYRAVLRFDVARTETPIQGYGFNFGLQQFFGI